MGSNHLLYFLLATVLHSKQYCMEEINKKRLLYIQNTVVYEKMESHDLSQKHYLLLECSFGTETSFLYWVYNWILLT